MLTHYLLVYFTLVIVKVQNVIFYRSHIEILAFLKSNLNFLNHHFTKSTLESQSKRLIFKICARCLKNIKFKFIKTLDPTVTRCCHFKLSWHEWPDRKFRYLKKKNFRETQIPAFPIPCLVTFLDSLFQEKLFLGTTFIYIFFIIRWNHF